MTVAQMETPLRAGGPGSAQTRVISWSASVMTTKQAATDVVIQIAQAERQPRVARVCPRRTVVKMNTPLRVKELVLSDLVEVCAELEFHLPATHLHRASPLRPCSISALKLK